MEIPISYCRYHVCSVFLCREMQEIGKVKMSSRICLFYWETSDGFLLLTIILQAYYAYLALWERGLMKGCNVKKDGRKRRIEWSTAKWMDPVPVPMDTPLKIWKNRINCHREDLIYMAAKSKKWLDDTK